MHRPRRPSHHFRREEGRPCARGEPRPLFDGGGGWTQRSPWPGGCELIRGHTVRLLPPHEDGGTPPKRGCGGATRLGCRVAISSTCYTCRPLIKNIGPRAIPSPSSEEETTVYVTRTYVATYVCVCARGNTHVYRGLNSRLITVPGIINFFATLRSPQWILDEIPRI